VLCSKTYDIHIHNVKQPLLVNRPSKRDRNGQASFNNSCPLVVENS
jgi:hypothetical protein